jgi:hypothetical protein
MMHSARFLHFVFLPQLLSHRATWANNCEPHPLSQCPVHSFPHRERERDGTNAHAHAHRHTHVHLHTHIYTYAVQDDDGEQIYDGGRDSGDVVAVDEGAGSAQRPIRIIIARERTRDLCKVASAGGQAQCVGPRAQRGIWRAVWGIDDRSRTGARRGIKAPAHVRTPRHYAQSTPSSRHDTGIRTGTREYFGKHTRAQT